MREIKDQISAKVCARTTEFSQVEYGSNLRISMGMDVSNHRQAILEHMYSNISCLLCIFLLSHWPSGGESPSLLKQSGLALVAALLAYLRISFMTPFRFGLQMKFSAD